MDRGTGIALRPKSPQTRATWDTMGKRNLSLHVSRFRRPHPLSHRIFLLPGKPGSEARWIRGGRWKRPSGSAGPLRRGLSGVWRDNTRW